MESFLFSYANEPNRVLDVLKDTPAASEADEPRPPTALEEFNAAIRHIYNMSAEEWAEVRKRHTEEAEQRRLAWERRPWYDRAKLSALFRDKTYRIRYKVFQWLNYWGDID